MMAAIQAFMRACRKAIIRGLLTLAGRSLPGACFGCRLQPQPHAGRSWPSDAVRYPNDAREVVTRRTGASHAGVNDEHHTADPGYL